jgi:hypothetical protein
MCDVACINVFSSVYEQSLVKDLTHWKKLQTFTLLFTSRRVGTFPFIVASATGSPLRYFVPLEAVFCKRFPKLMTGTTVLVPGMVWYWMERK